MIVYFADRHMNILGVASDLLPGAFHIRDDMTTKEIETGVSTFEITVDYGKDTHLKAKDFCRAGNFILVKAKDGTYTPYTIIDREDDIADRHIYIYAEDAGLDLLNEIVPAYESLAAQTASAYILAFTADSGFEIGTDELGTSLTRTLNWDGEETATARIRSVATEFDNAELSYSFTIDKFRITHKYINIYKKHGKDVALELRFGREVDSLTEKESVANLVTALRCVGGTPDATDANPEPIPITFVDENTNPPTIFSRDDGDIYTDGVYLKSREANKKWSRYLTESGSGEGYIVGSFDYDTTSQEELYNRAVTELKKLREPEITYTVTLNTIPDNLKIGDTCRIIDDNGELYVSARLIELKVSECNNTREATFGDFKKLTSGINEKVEKLAEEFAKIQAAKTLYTWIVFADDSQGTNISTSSEGKSYIGIATNKISPDPVLDANLYTFTRISAIDGRGFTVKGSWAPNTSYSITGTNIDVVEYEGSTYACNNSHVSSQTFDPSKWVLIAEKGTDGQDGHSPVVSATKTGGTTTIKVDGSTIATILDGTDGVDGHSPTITTSKSGDTTTIYADGVSIGTVTDGDDGHSPSVTATKTDGVTTVKVDGTTIATINDGSSVIIQSATKVGDTTTVILKDGSGTKTLTIKDGEDGDNGQPGSNGDDAYVHIAWATSADGSEGFSTSVSEGKTYMGSYSDHTLADSQTPSDYNWSLIKGEDGYSPTATVTKSGSTATITITDKNGTTTETVSDGTSATSYSLIVSHAAIVKAAESNSYTPSSIDLSSKSQTGSGAFGNYAGRFKIETYNGTSWTARYTSGTNESSHSYAIPTNIDGIKAIRCSLYLAGGTTTLIDQQVVPIVSDGTSGSDGEDAYTVVLTNENYTFVGSETAAIASNTSTGLNVAECNVIAYKGATQIASHIGTISGKPTDGMTTSISSNDSTSAKFTVTVSTSMATKNGVLTIPVYIDPASSSGKLFNMKFTYSLAIKGVDGRAITGVTNYYLATSASSGVTRSTSGWTTSVQSMTSTNQYLWNYEKLTYSSGTTTTYTDPVIIGRYGKDGQGGSDGKGITGITEYYQKSSSNSQAPTTWVTTPPTTTTSEPYLWNYEVITYTTGDPFTSEKRVIGIHGATGATGATGASGQDGDDGYNQATIYLYRRSATTISTKPGAATYTFSTGSLTSVSNWTRTIPADDGTPCYVSSVSVKSRTNTASIAQADWSSPILLITSSTKWYSGTAITGTSSTATAYSTGIAYANVGDHYINTSTQNVYRCTVAGNASTAKWVYEQNIQGPQGVSGINGTSSYFHVKYSNDGGTTFTGNSGEDPGDYIGTYTDNNAADSTSVSAYTWVRVTGLNQATIYLYKRSATAVSTKPAGATYTFSTGALTSVSGWSRSIPASDGTPCYVSWVSVSSTASSVTINQNDWSTPIKLVEDGAKGETGATGATGENGSDGKSLRGSYIRDKWTNTQWTGTYGAIDHTASFSNYDILSSGTQTNGKYPITTWEVGDLFFITGTATDSGIAYTATYVVTSKPSSNTGTVSSKCTAFSHAKKGDPGEDGNGIVSKTDYYMLADTMDSSALSEARSHLPHDMTGTVVTISDAMGDIPFENVTVDIAPIQSGSGDPSPTNVRPITGWTGASITAAGKNLLRFINESRTTDGVTYMFGDDGSVTVNGTSTSTNSFANINYVYGECSLPKGVPLRIALVCNKSTAEIGVRVYSSNSRISNFYTTTQGISISNPFVIPQDETTVWARMQVTTKDSSFDNVVIRPMIIADDGAADFEEYVGRTYDVSWQNEAGTVYGGTLDVTNGVLTVTMAMVDLGTLNWESTVSGVFYALGSRLAYKRDESSKVVCSKYIFNGSGSASSSVVQKPDKTIYLNLTLSGSMWVFVKDTSYTDAATFKAAMSGVQLCYELAEPVTYQLTPVEINSLAGLNNVWADTGDISLTYFDEHDATWQTAPVDPNQYSRYQWWYYNTTYTDGTSVDSDPAVIGIYNQDWYDETQKAIADAESASQTANDAAKAAEANAGALRNISDIVNGTENTTGLVDQINSISNTMATASSVEELREEKNQDLERLISNYSLSDFLNWFHFDQNQGLIIGKTTTTGSANYVLRLEGDIISFYELTGNVSDLNDQQRVGYFQNRNLMSENIVALSTFDLGNFRFMKQDSGNLSFVYTG